MLELALVVIASFLAAVVLTPVIRSLAIRMDIVDKPDGHRKLHGRIIARAGGTAVLAAVLAVSGIAMLGFDLSRLNTGQIAPFLTLFSAMIGIWLLGLADDIWTLRGRQKLAVQALLAALLVAGGFKIGSVQLFGHGFDLGWYSIPVSMVWLLATTNALNLIDGADGLCSTLGAVICGSLGVLASVNGHFAEAAIAFAFCGALLGFLVYNFPPASIFLGDSGSLLVGMVSGALAIRCSLKGPASVAFLAPLAILALPLLDSLMAIVRRKLTGRSIYTTDRAHLHHTLRNRGLGDRGLLLTVAVLSMITAAGALAGQLLGRDWLAPVSVIVVFGMLVTTKAFGYAEVLLVARKGTHFALSFLEPASSANSTVREKTVRLQGTRQWETVWQTIVEFAESEGLCRVHMDLNVPWIEEGFHGTWQRSRMPDRLERWSASMPIFANEKLTGRLDVIGPAIESLSLESMRRMTELLEDLIPQIEMLMLSDGVPSLATSGEASRKIDARTSARRDGALEPKVGIVLSEESASRSSSRIKALAD